MPGSAVQFLKWQFASLALNEPDCSDIIRPRESSASNVSWSLLKCNNLSAWGPAAHAVSITSELSHQVGKGSPKACKKPNGLSHHLCWNSSISFTAFPNSSCCATAALLGNAGRNETVPAFQTPREYVKMPAFASNLVVRPFCVAVTSTLPGCQST